MTSSSSIDRARQAGEVGQRVGRSPTGDAHGVQHDERRRALERWRSSPSRPSVDHGMTVARTGSTVTVHAGLHPPARRRVADDRRDAELAGDDRGVRDEAAVGGDEGAGVDEHVFHDGLVAVVTITSPGSNSAHRRGRVVDDERPARCS